MVITNNTEILIRNTRTGTITTLLKTDLNDENRVTGKVVAGIPFTDTIDDSLDSFVIQLKDYPERDLFKPFDFVVFTVNDGLETVEKKYFVLFDNVQTYSQARKTYVHNISLVEPTKILEKIKIFNLNLTNQNDTFETQILKAILNAEPVFYNLSFEKSAEGSKIYKKERRLFFARSLTRFVQNKASRDFYFSNTDLRSVLDEMLGAYNARITVENVEYYEGNISRLELGCRDLTKINEVTPIWTKEEQGEIIFEQAENDGQNHAGTIVARGNNSLVEEAITFTDTFKANSSEKVDDKTACVILPFPISEKGFKKFIIKNIKIRYDDMDQAGGTYHFHEYVDLDVSERILAQQQYELLDNDTAKVYIPYSLGDKILNVGVSTTRIFGVVTNNLTEIIADLAPKNPPSGTSGYFTSIVSKFYNLTFTCTYYPLINTVASISKPNVYDKDDLLMGIMDSQTEQTLDIDRHGKKLAGLIKRTGNAEYYMDVKAKYYSKLLPLMSKINLPDADSEEEKGYVLYKREYSIYDNFINCRYYFSKDFNAVQQNAGVNREKHLFDIPLESSETPIVVKKYLVFSTEQQLKGGFDQSLCVSALNTLIGKNESKGYTVPDTQTLKTAGGKLQYLLFQVKGEDGVYPQDTENSENKTPYKDDAHYRFARPICSYALNKTMTFMANCLDNYSVDYSRDGYKFSVWGDGGNRVTYNRYVDKTKETIGEAKTFELDFAFAWKYDGEDGKNANNSIAKFPVVKNTDFATCGLSGAPLMVEYNKDRTQTPLFVFALECIASKEDYGKIMIGTDFARKNNLVRNNGKGLEGLSLYTYENAVFNGNENSLPDGYKTNVSIDSVFSVIGWTQNLASGAMLQNNGTAQDCGSWAIADEQGNIFLAVNGTLCDIYVSVANFPY